VSVVGGTVLACRATLKVSDTLSDIEKDLQIAREKSNLLEDSGHAVAKTYAKSAVQMVRLYGPAVVVGGVGVACLVGSHRQLTSRNNSLMAAYTALEAALTSYRSRVREAVGEEREEQLYRGVNAISRKGVETLEVDADNLGPYSAMFDHFCGPWKPDPELNRIFLQCQLNRWNLVLSSRGHVFLNEVLESLGKDQTSMGQIVGWMRNSEDGDGYIDFGMLDVMNMRFAAGLEASILLSFNVDGIIYNKI
jgi:hypothetical protein